MYGSTYVYTHANDRESVGLREGREITLIEWRGCFLHRRKLRWLATTIPRRNVVAGILDFLKVKSRHPTVEAVVSLHIPPSS